MERRILVRYGGHLPRVTNREEEWIASDTELSLSLLLTKIYERYKDSPESKLFGDPRSFLITLNGKFVPASHFDEVLVRDGDVLILLPPVSGG
jgi:molybdopterin converting factor small subunit